MSNAYFQFKQFRVGQEQCAMKVTTDACIQGAWTPVLPGLKRVLDIGTGTGLLSLMLAQRHSTAVIDAVEIDADAAQQANANIAASPWAERIQVLEGDVCNYVLPAKYDLIISNPPFFNNSLLGPHAHRNKVRHTISLTYATLLKSIEDNLAPNGYASVLLPYAEYLQWKTLIDAAGWHETDRLLVCHRPGAVAKRVVCIFSKQTSGATRETTLVIQDENNNYSSAFIDLLAPFYLHL